MNVSSFDYEKIQNHVNPTNIIFTYEPSNLFIGEISYLRAFRINFEKKFKTYPYIECIIKVVKKNTLQSNRV